MASAVKTPARALQGALQAAAFARFVMGLTHTLMLSSLLFSLSLRRRLEGLVAFNIEKECHFCLDYCLRASVKGEAILTLAYGSAYLWTQSHPEEHALVVIGDVSTLAGSDNIGAEKSNGLIGLDLPSEASESLHKCSAESGPPGYRRGAS
jgi:hypothetical protein